MQNFSKPQRHCFIAKWATYPWNLTLHAFPSQIIASWKCLSKWQVKAMQTKFVTTKYILLVSSCSVIPTCTYHDIISFLQFQVRATDSRPLGVVRSAEATVVITITRDQGPPVFTRTPYSTVVPINQAVNTTFYTVSAFDNDLRVSHM